MKIFKIVKDSNPNLRNKCKNVEFPLSEEIKTTLFDMLEYLKLSQDPAFLEKHPNITSGVGLAAPQIGLNLSMVAIYFLDEKNNPNQYLLVNPKIVSESDKRCYLESGEGCLSVPKPHEGYVYRAFKVTVKAFDLLKNDFVTYEFKGFGAIVVQHELDHLKGVLYYDHINKTNPFEKKTGAVVL